MVTEMATAFCVNPLQVGFFGESQASHCLNDRKTCNIFSSAKPEKVRVSIHMLPLLSMCKHATCLSYYWLWAEVNIIRCSVNKPLVIRGQNSDKAGFSVLNCVSCFHFPRAAMTCALYTVRFNFDVFCRASMGTLNLIKTHVCQK